MSLTAEDLVGTRIVFALAQKPYLLESGEHIATLAPLMNLESGELLQGSPQTFPCNGYVFWWSVAPGTWKPGDIVVGTIERSRKFGEPNQEWYQVHSNRGSAVRDEVYDTMTISSNHPDGHRWLIDGRCRLVSATPPCGDFYVWTNDELIGPFHSADIEPERGQFSFICTPADARNGVVMRYPRESSNAIPAQPSKSVDVTVSLTDSSPQRHNSDDRVRQYRLIRGADLECWQTDAQSLTLLPDKLIVSRACKRIVGRSKRREARAQLEALVNNLKEENAANENDVHDGLMEILRQVKVSDAVTNQLVQAIVQSGEFDKRIQLAVDQTIESAVAKRATEIEERANQAAASKLAELASVEVEIDRLKSEKEELGSAILELEEKRVANEMRAEELMASVTKRLETGREELLGDLALLAPLLGSNDALPANNRQDAESTPTEEDRHAGYAQARFDELKSPALTETQFIEKRLWPCLITHGCQLNGRDAEFYHATVLAARLVGIPHPGWAVGYAEAMGGTGAVHVVSASPNWLSFHDAFQGALAAEWRNSVNDPSRLHLIVIEGIDRCPSHAWLRPWLSVLAGWTSALPDENCSPWPEHVRLCVTLERSEACFELPEELRQWVLDFASTSSNEAAPAIEDGHFPFEDWILPTSEKPEDDLHGFVDALELPPGKPYSRTRTELAWRLRDALLRLNEEDAPRCDAIISKRLFRCWSEENSQ